MASTFRGLLPSGRLPSAAELQVRDLIQTEAPPPDLSLYPTRSEVEDDLHEAISPLVSRDEMEQAIDAIEPLPLGDIPIFPTVADAQAWEAANPGRMALTVEDTSPDVIPPTPGTLTIEPEGTFATAIITGATDDRITPLEYSVTVNGGTTWTAWTTDSAIRVSGLSVSRDYTAQHRVRDRGPNIATGAPVDFRTLAADRWGTGWTDYFTSNGALVGKPMSSGAGVWEAIPQKSGGLHDASPIVASGLVRPTGSVALDSPGSGDSVWSPVVVRVPSAPTRVEMSFTSAANGIDSKIAFVLGVDADGNGLVFRMNRAGAVLESNFIPIGDAGPSRSETYISSSSGPTWDPATWTMSLIGRSFTVVANGITLYDLTIPQAMSWSGTGYGVAWNNVAAAASHSLSNFSIRWE